MCDMAGGSSSPKEKVVLIVDDDDYVCEFLRFILEREGFKALEANDGEAALKIVRSKKIDLVLLDWMMPMLNGIDVLRWVRAHQNRELSSTPVLVLTTSSSRIDIEDAYANGANAYMAKPVKPTEFETVIQSTLHYWAKTVELP